MLGKACYNPNVASPSGKWISIITKFDSPNPLTNAARRAKIRRGLKRPLALAGATPGRGDRETSGAVITYPIRVSSGRQLYDSGCVPHSRKDPSREVLAVIVVITAPAWVGVWLMVGRLVVAQV